MTTISSKEKMNSEEKKATNESDDGYHFVDRPLVIIYMYVYVYLYPFIYHVSVYCSDLDELLLRTIQSRGLDHSQVEPLIGVDGGQGFLKVGLILNECQTVEESKGKRSKYSEVFKKI